jgi:hypothetical protein
MPRIIRAGGCAHKWEWGECKTEGTVHPVVLSHTSTLGFNQANGTLSRYLIWCQHLITFSGVVAKNSNSHSVLTIYLGMITVYKIINYNFLLTENRNMYKEKYKNNCFSRKIGFIKKKPGSEFLFNRDWLILQLLKNFN